MTSNGAASHEKRRHRQGKGGNGGEGEGRSSGWAGPSDVAKWIIPSFGALFVLIGYVVRGAHESLLGFPGGRENLESSALTADAADFLRDLLTTVGDAFFDLLRGHVSLGGHGVFVSLCLAGAVFAALTSRLPWFSKNDDRSAFACGVVVVLLASTKFVYLDAPLTHLESIMVGTAQYEGAGPSEKQTGIRWPWSEPASADSGASTGRGDALMGGIRERTRTLWSRMVCSRIGGIGLPGNPTWSGAFCAQDAMGRALPPASSASAPVIDNDRDTWRDALQGEYLARVAVSACVAAAACMLLVRPGHLAKVVALLALFGLLSLPYAYGKLWKPLDFIYARLVLATSSPHGLLSAPADLNQGAGAVPKSGPVVLAFVVGRDRDHIDLLEAVEARCSKGTTRELRFASLPSSQVLAIEEILRRDLLEWKVAVEKTCPSNESPYGVPKDSQPAPFNQPAASQAK